jgi:hypothetical protein
MCYALKFEIDVCITLGIHHSPKYVYGVCDIFCETMSNNVRYIQI